MSYICHATQQLIYGERCVLVPIKIRKVVYIAQTRPDSRSNFLQFAGQSEGWETVKEVPVRPESAEWFRTANPPEIASEVKEVRFMLPRQVKEKAPPRHEEELDKPEM
jgi:hypothetical protein